MFLVYSFIQSAIAIAGDGDLSRVILYAAGAIVVGAMGWVVKITRDVKIAVTRIRDCLTGYTGNQGLIRDVEVLRADVDELLDRRSGADRREDRAPRDVPREDLP